MDIAALALCLSLNAQFDQRVPFDEFAVAKFHADVRDFKGRGQIDRAYIGAKKRMAVMDFESKSATLDACETDFAALMFAD